MRLLCKLAAGVIRYSWMVFALLLLYNPAFAQEEQGSGPELFAAQMGKKTVVFLPANWTISATHAEITLTSSAPIEKALASDWWQAEVEPSKVTFRLAENVARPSKFAIYTNSTEATYSYSMTLNSTDYHGRIAPETSVREESRFVRWADGEENAASAFIPEEWKADLQLIRPYKSMTGFVFFARGGENTLVYVFQPFMPLHLLPGESICAAAGQCSGQVSSEKVKEMSFGNAPVAISGPKTPEQYFTSEVLPVLKRNLNGYSVKSSLPVYAMSIGGSSALSPALDVEYSFDVEGKKIAGRAMVLVRNHTAGDIGFWNGFIVGVESEETNFVKAFQQAAVTLLTLKFDSRWLGNEEKVLVENAKSSHALSAVSALMANSTLGDFNSIVPTAAHKLVRTYNDTMVAGFADTKTDEQLLLPLFPDTRHWYLEDGKLLGRKSGINPMNSSTLEPLF